MNQFCHSVLLFVMFVAGVCPHVAQCQITSRQAGSISDETPADAQAPLLNGITVHRRKITTNSAEAQRYFDQGLNLVFAFNHDEAIRSFTEAAKFDPACAMAWWGIALCHGPHINNPVMDEPRSAAACEALSKAQAHCESASPVEQALIRALASRYAEDIMQNIEQREALNRAYAAAMQDVQKRFDQDPDVAVLCAEAIMDLRPWDLWSDDGQPRPETPQVLTLLEAVLARQPNHPGANHLYIHAVEASPHPEQGIAAADRLRTLMPGSGHMVHMPSHIYVRIGKWSQAADQNDRAILVDATYRQASPRQDFYQIYMLHNPHFLAFTCMMEGRRADALRAARSMLGSMPAEFRMNSAALADPFLSIEYQVLVRFGQWDEVLRLPTPSENLPITTAMWHFARATALAAKGDIGAAEDGQRRFRQAVAAVPEDAVGAINKAHDILRVGQHTLAGEIAFQTGDLETAVAELRQGVLAEEALLYMEPPEWIQPVRHSLGAVLIAAHRWKEAEEVYRADLVQWPENGWALYGLARALRGLGDDPQAAEVERRFQAAWSRADTKVHATCLCVPGGKE